MEKESCCGKAPVGTENVVGGGTAGNWEMEAFRKRRDACVTGLFKRCRVR